MGGGSYAISSINATNKDAIDSASKAEKSDLSESVASDELPSEAVANNEM